jgi:hypothetical protein
MPKSSKAKLAFQRAYNKRPEELAKRIKNNQARATAIKEGRAAVGDGKDVAHIKPLNDGGGNTPGNLRVQSEAENRGWRKGKKGKGSYDV